MRQPFNDSCDIFKGPGTFVPGLFVGNFPCRFVRETGIVPDDIGYPHTIAYLTIDAYDPIGCWTAPFFGVDATLADQIEIASLPGERYWVVFSDTINWHGQASYYRAYLASLPLPANGPQGGVVIGGNALPTIIREILPTGGVLLGGAAAATFVRNIDTNGGVLIGGTALPAFERTYTPTGGVLIGGTALPAFERTYTPTGGVLIGGTAVPTFVPGITYYWKDTFTDTNNTLFTAHTGEVTPGGYTFDLNTWKIVSNTGENVSTTGRFRFDPGQTVWNYSCKFVVNEASGQIFFFFRNTDDFNRWRVQVNFSAGSATGFTLGCSGGTSFTGTGTVTLNTGTQYTVSISVNGASVSATINGVTVSTSNISHASSTLMKIQYFGSTAAVCFLDDLFVTN